VMASEIVLPAIDLPRFGDPDGVAGPPSGGRGSAGGIGDGYVRRWVTSHGPGLWSGPRRRVEFTGGGGGFPGSVTQPVLLWKIEPEYTDEARAAKIPRHGGFAYSKWIPAARRKTSPWRQRAWGWPGRARPSKAVRRWRFRPPA